MQTLKSLQVWYLSVMLMLFAGAVHAAVPAGVTSAITDAQADVTSVGGLILIVVVSIAAIMWIRSVLHR